jgi:hypothetical protein
MRKLIFLRIHFTKVDCDRRQSKAFGDPTDLAAADFRVIPGAEKSREEASTFAQRWPPAEKESSTTVPNNLADPKMRFRICISSADTNLTKHNKTPVYAAACVNRSY